MSINYDFMLLALRKLQAGVEADMLTLDQLRKKSHEDLVQEVIRAQGTILTISKNFIELFSVHVELFNELGKKSEQQDKNSSSG